METGPGGALIKEKIRMNEEDFKETLATVAMELAFRDLKNYYAITTPINGKYSMILVLNGRPEQLVEYAAYIARILHAVETASVK